MTLRPQPGNLRDAAIRYANQSIPILPDQLGSHRPDLAGVSPVCTCRRRDCPAPRLHAPRRLDRDSAAQRTSHVGRWWTANPDAAIATVTGAAFDVIEIHSAMPPEAILEWLSRQRLMPGPVLFAGLGRLQLLAAPDSYQADRYDSATAAILYLAPGSLLLLPPSHLADGQSITWLRPLDPSADLPNGAALFWTLVELPANHQLADPDVYTFPAQRQPRHAGSSW